MFVHLAPEKDAARILKNGLRPRRWRIQEAGGGERTVRVVFAMPVTRDYYVSHQWLRELKGTGQRTIAAVYFKVLDDEDVYVGHYSRPRVRTTAGRAIRAIREAPDARGFEVLIPRRVEAREIARVRVPRQVLGWRYSPDSHTRRPCPCDYCQKGKVKARRVRERSAPSGI